MASWEKRSQQRSENPEEDQSTDPMVVSQVIASSRVSRVPREGEHCPGLVEKCRKRMPLSDGPENCCIMLNLRGGQSERSYFS